MERPHRHDAVELNQLLSGRLTYRIAGRRADVAPGGLVLFWGAIPHRVVDVAEGTEFLCATIPLPTFLGWGLDEPFVRDVLAGSLRVGPTALGMARWPGDLTADRDSAETRRIVRLEMEAAVRRIAREGGTAGTVGIGLAERMAACIARRSADPITVDDVAAEVGVHPATAMRRFRAETGSTIAEYLRDHRLAHATRLLAATDQAVEQVGRDVGFGSASAFYAAFVAAYGVPPAAYRKGLKK